MQTKRLILEQRRGALISRDRVVVKAAAFARLLAERAGAPGGCGSARRWQRPWGSTPRRSLADHDDASLLNLVQHTVAIGNPGGGFKGLCPKTVSEAEDPRPLSWSGKTQFEAQPPCDFILADAVGRHGPVAINGPGAIRSRPTSAWMLLLKDERDPLRDFFFEPGGRPGPRRPRRLPFLAGFFGAAVPSSPAITFRTSSCT